MDFPDYVTVPELQEEILRLRARVAELEAAVQVARDLAAAAARPRSGRSARRSG